MFFKIHATNRTSTPNIHYIVDAVECLKEAYTVYPDDLSRAKLYVQLFEDKHPETQWNVVIGYTVAQISSQWYVETTVSGGSNKNKKSDKDDDKEMKYLIFSRQ